MSNKQIINVLLIEDDPMVQEVNRQFIERVPGFNIVDIASNGMEGMVRARELNPDLIILDIFMPEKDGMETLENLRTERLDIDIIVITAANDKSRIRTMLQNGAIDYIVKPFKFERLERALNYYRTFNSHVSGEGVLQQHQIDGLIGSVKNKHRETVKGNLLHRELPKGLNQQTLKQIILYLEQQTVAISAEKAAEGIGIARVTARRYLDYLQKTGEVDVEIQYGGVGRPVNRYKMT